MREKRENLSVKESIQTRLSSVMVLVLVFVLCINFFIFEQIHTGVDRIDAVFSSNAAINDLSETLNKVEGTVYEYLNTKGSKALENYYRYEQEYRQLLDGFNDRNVDSEVKMLENQTLCSEDTLRKNLGLYVLNMSKNERRYFVQARTSDDKAGVSYYYVMSSRKKRNPKVKVPANALVETYALYGYTLCASDGELIQ